MSDSANLQNSSFIVYHPSLKVVVAGPESSGKTTLAAALAERLGWACVPEFSRVYLQHLGREYVREDLPRIAAGQMAWEDWHAERARAPIVCDTDLTVLHIWSLHKYGAAEPSIAENLRRRPADFYLLAAPDFEWQPDPLRENPHDRDVLFAKYEALLQELGVPFLVLTGDPATRLEAAVAKFVIG